MPKSVINSDSCYLFSIAMNHIPFFVTHLSDFQSIWAFLFTPDVHPFQSMS